MPSVTRMPMLQILGLQDLKRSLRSMAEKDSRRIIAGALRDSAELVRAEAERLAPKQTVDSKGRPIPGAGMLKKSIRVSKEKKRKRDRIEAYVLIAGPKRPRTAKAKARAEKKRRAMTARQRADADVIAAKNPRKYAHLVEFGTQPHAVGKGAKLEQTREDGRVRAGTHQRGSMHPGARPKPFMRPAIASKGPEAVRMFSERVRAGVAEHFSGRTVRKGGAK